MVDIIFELKSMPKRYAASKPWLCAASVQSVCYYAFYVYVLAYAYEVVSVCVCVLSFRWERSRTFVGSVIDLSGCESHALDHRIAQATKALGWRRPILCCKWVSSLRRSYSVHKVIFDSALWTTERLSPLQALRSCFNSWGARTVVRPPKLT